MGRSLHSLLVRAISSIWGLVVLATGAFAYPMPVDFDGSLLRWNIGVDDAPITYEIVAARAADRTVYASAVDDAAQLWTDVPGSYFAFEPVADGAVAQVTINLDSAIEGGAYSSGYALFDGYEGNKPSHCSIHVTVDSSVSYNGLAKTILHELGHCAGLGHTLIPEAIMSYDLEKNSFGLDVDDEAALVRLYPADGSKPKLPPGCAVGPDQKGFGPLLLALFLLLPLAGAIRGSNRS